MACRDLIQSSKVESNNCVFLPTLEQNDSVNASVSVYRFHNRNVSQEVRGGGRTGYKNALSTSVLHVLRF